MKLGIYGGTFAPIHNAHVKAAKAFRDELDLDKILIIPAGIPPHKQTTKGDKPEQRLQMCKLAFEGEIGIEVSDIELVRSGKSYTVLTLRELAAEDRELYFLCGTDMLLSFDRWYCFEEIFKLCTLVYARRENDRSIDPLVEEKIKEYKERYGARIKKLSCDVLELSSTEVREMIKNGEDVTKLIPVNVHEFIKENRLYGG